MLLEAKEIVGLPIGDLEGQSKVGEVSRLIIDPDNMAVLAVVVDTGNFLFKKIFLISFRDIVDIDKRGVVIKSRKELIHPKELVRAYQLLNKNFNLIGLRARAEKSKKYLGRVFDYLVDTTLGTVQKIYIKRLFQERVIPISQIVRLTFKEIIVKDEKEIKEAETAVAAEIEPV